MLQFIIALVASLLFVAKAGSNGMVCFVETSPGNYLKQSSLEGSEFSEADVAASVAVLLGVDPPLTMSQSSALKLDELLSPDPFQRPRRVAFLMVEGLDTDYLKEKNMTRVLGVQSVVSRELTFKSSKKALKHLGGKEVRLESLNYPVSEDFDLVFLKEGLQQLDISVQLPPIQKDEEEIVTLFVGGTSLQFDLSKKSDFRFIADLLSLAAGVKRAQESHHSLSGEDTAELFFGTLSGLKALKQEREDEIGEASQLLLVALSKTLQQLEAVSDGNLVTIVSFPSSGAHHVVREMIGKHYHSRASRYLVEEFKKPQTVELLARRTLAASTSIILIVASLLGTWCLCYMPLVRDSLLYSGKIG